MYPIPLIAEHLEQLGYTEFELVSETHLRIGDGAILYDEIFGYTVTKNFLKPLFLSYLTRK